MDGLGAHKWMVTITVLLAVILELLNMTIVNVALTQMMGNLGATLDEINWVVTAYIVANVIVIPMAGWLSALLGRRNYFVGSVLLFTLASFLCGISTNIWELVFFRLLQGIGGGALLTIAMEVLVLAFPARELPLAMSMFGMAATVAPSLGPLLGGWLTDNLTWPWIYFMNVPVGLVAAWMAWHYLHEPGHGVKAGRVDGWGIALLAVSLGAMQTVLERGQAEDWFSSRLIVRLTVISVIALVAFVWRELATDHPVVDLRVLRHRSLAVGTFLSLVQGFGLNASLFLFPVFLQGLLGQTATRTGQMQLVDGSAMTVTLMLGGVAMQRGVSKRLMTALGFAFMAVFFWMMSHSTLQSGRADFVAPLVFRGLGLALMMLPVITLAMVGLQGAEVAQGSGLVNMTRQLGGSFGVAAITAYVQRGYWGNRAGLLEHVSVYDPVVQERLHTFTAGFVGKGFSALQAQMQAHAAIEMTVAGQAWLISYMDAFRFMAVFFVCCLPLVLLFKRETGGGGAPAMLH
jgi:MFS transporter, DHA2 family, multidrug resistance protein